MEDYVIEPKEGAKGRSFSATCLAFATADSLWESGGKTIRPAWAMFAGSDAELRPFMTNLRLGRKAELASNQNRRGGDEDRLEFLKSAGYQITWQREPEGTIATIFYPDLFRLDPGMVDPTGIKFVVLAPTDWSKAQRVDVTPAVQHVQSMLRRVPKLRERDYRLEGRASKLDADFLAGLVPTAYLFAAFLDRRTRCPLVADGRFYLQLLIAALDQGLASLPGNNARYNSSRDDWGHNTRHAFNMQIGGKQYAKEGPETIGVKHAISFLATHEVFETFLAEQVTTFFGRVAGDFKPTTERVDFSEFSQAV